MKAQLGKNPLLSSLTELLSTLGLQLAANWKHQFLDKRVPPQNNLQHGSWLPSESASETVREGEQEEVVIFFNLASEVIPHQISHHFGHSPLEASLWVQLILKGRGLHKGINTRRWRPLEAIWCCQPQEITKVMFWRIKDLYVEARSTLRMEKKNHGRIGVENLLYG